ncbi:hypothetical protein [Mycobacterium sp.]|uniref:hypothetical protein n=1 Tax=Mycobacterium sp. TaxID=1785 RepID=UPI003F9AE166
MPPNMPSETAREATEALCLAVIADVELAEQVWDTLPPVMHYLVVMAHRELLTRKTDSGSTWMDVLPDWLTRERTDEDVQRIIGGVVHDYAAELLGL